jgi:hypothetical protein
MRPTQVVLALALTSRTLLTSAWAQILHYDAREATSRGPVTNAALDARIQEMAAQYRSYAPVPRVAFYDVAYPADSAEYLAMHGYALLVLTAIDQDSSELPPARIYVVSTSGSQDLPLVTLRPSLVADTGVKATFGTRRLDALYLLPVPLRNRGGQLLLDFAKNRQGFRLGLFDAALPAAAARMTQLRAEAGLPPLAAVWAMFQREYPDLAGSVRQGAP